MFHQKSNNVSNNANYASNNNGEPFKWIPMKHRDDCSWNYFKKFFTAFSSLTLYKQNVKNTTGNYCKMFGQSKGSFTSEGPGYQKWE